MREPRWLLPLGILTCAAMLVLIWLSAARTGSTYARQVVYARLNTFTVASHLHDDLAATDGPSIPVISVTAREAGEFSARMWQTLAYTAPTPAARGEAGLAAGILYAFSEHPGKGREVLAAATSAEPARARVYREFLPLCDRYPDPVTLSPEAEALLARTPAGPMWRAQQALLRLDKAGALAALQPQARAGQRATSVVALTNNIGGWTVLIGAIALLVSAVWRGMRDREDRQRPFPAVPWGPGAALLALVAHVAVALLVGRLLCAAANAAGMAQPWLVYPAGGCGALVSGVVVLPFFLRLHGCRPWEWRALGWRWSWRALWLGPAALLLAAPILGIAQWASDRLVLHNEAPMAAFGGAVLPTWGMLAAMAAVAIVGPFVDETIYRGILQPAIGARVRAVPTLLFTALLFAATHGAAGALLPIGALGLALGYLAWRSGSLWASALMHGLFNLHVVGSVLLLAWAAQG